MTVSVVDFFGDRQEDIQIDGKQSEKAFIVRRGRSTKSTVINDEKKMLLNLASNLRCGDKFTRADGTSWYVVARQSNGACVECQARRINSTIGIYAMENIYDSLELVGCKEIEVADNVSAYYKDVSANMQILDAGLLKDTVKIILIRDTEDIKELYRVKLNGADYQVDNIDTGRYENMYYVQLSEDTRAVIDE